MQSRQVVAGGALLAVLGWTSAAAAGWVLEQAVKGTGQGAREQIFVQGNRLKMQALGPDGRPADAFIVDLNTDTVLQVSYGERQYVAASMQEYVQAMTGVMQAAAGQMAAARQQMEQAMKDMPPEQRKMMEQMMRQQMPQAGGAGKECVEPRVEFRKTGQQATIAGFPAVRWEVLSDGKVDSELWMARGLDMTRELDFRKLEQFGTAMAKISACGSGRGGGHEAGGAWRLAAEGYPVRTVTPGAGGMTVELVKAESRPIAASEFQPPAGFARKTLRETMGQ